MNKRTYLLQEIEGWKKTGLISPAQAAALELQYSKDTTGEILSRTPGMIFGSFGAIAFGLGIILLVAFNWAELSKETKIFFTLSPILIFHGLGLLARMFKFSDYIVEILHLLGSMMLGAAIILMAQIYNISDHFPNGIFAWAAGTFLLFIILQSRAQGILSIILFCIYWTSECTIYRPPLEVNVVLLAGQAIVLCTFMLWAYWKRSLAIMVPAIILFFTSLCACFFIWTESGTCHEMTLSRMIIAACIPLFFYGCWYFMRNEESRMNMAKLFKFVGHITFFPGLIAITFSETIYEIHGIGMLYYVVHPYLWSEIMIGALLVLGGIALPVIYGIVIFRRKNCPLSVKINNWIPILTILLYIGVLIADMNNYLTVDIRSTSPLYTLGAILFSIILLYLLLTHIWNACKERQILSLALFTFALGTWLLIRFFTWFDDLVVRGIAFLCVGVFLILIGIVYSKMNPKKKTEA